MFRLVHSYAGDNASRVKSFNTTGSGTATRDIVYEVQPGDIRPERDASRS